MKNCINQIHVVESKAHLAVRENTQWQVRSIVQIELDDQIATILSLAEYTLEEAEDRCRM